MQVKWQALSLASFAALSITAHAEETPKDPAAWTGDVELAYLINNGNTKSKTQIGKFSADREGIVWRQSSKVEGYNTQARDSTTGQDERTAEKYFSTYKLDRKLGASGRNYVFNIGTYTKDNFSGFHYEASYALGLGRRWLDSDKHKLDTEAGPGYRVQCLEPEDSYSDCQNKQEDGIGRVALKYEWKISDTATFKEDIYSEVSESSAVSRAETSLTSQINTHFALRISHLIKHNSDPAFGKRETDSELLVSLVYGF